VVDLAGFDPSTLDPETRAILEEYLGTQEAILEAAELGNLNVYTPYKHQLRLHQAMETLRFLLGANRIGKSWFLAQEIRYFALGEHPYRHLRGPARLIWACCPTEELMLMYQFPSVRKAIGEQNIKEVKLGAHPRIILKNGCIILFKYYAQGPKAFPSAGVDLIALDEEPNWAIFEECLARRSTRELNIIGAITTVGGLTPLIQKIVNNELPNCMYTTAKLDDNPAIPLEEREAMKQALKNNPVAYRIRVLGEILPVGGSTRFDANAMYEMQLKYVRDPIARFSFDMTHQRWVQGDTGPLWVWELAKPGHEYCIGGDVAEGLNVSESDVDPVWDNTSLFVFDRNDRKFVAEYTCGNQEPGDIGDLILPRLHSLYNRAYANIELNLHGYTVVTMARRHMSSRLWSPIEDETKRLQKPLQALGSLMTGKSRTHAIDVLARELSDRTFEIYSGHAVREMMTFVKKANGRVEHQDGCHDDRVFALAHTLVCDNGLPPPKLRRPPTEREELRKWALARPRRERRVNWFRRIA